MTITILEKAASALTSNDHSGMRIAASNLVTLVRSGQTEFIPPLLVVADALAVKDVPAAVAAARVARSAAPFGSALELQAVASWSKHVDALAVRRPAGAIQVARDAPLGTALRQAGVAMLLRLETSSLKQPETVAVQRAISSFMQKFSRPAPFTPA